MKIIEPSVEILPQEGGIIGMLKHAEKLGRVAYQSQDKITDTSYFKFTEQIKNRGHWAVFDSATVYLSVPTTERDLIKLLKSTHPFTRWNEPSDSRGYIYFTTTYRIILKNNLQEEMGLYWSEPGEYHKKRISFIWTCSRSTAFQAVRHRIFSFIMESTRYCNYSKSKFGGELTFILPQWIYRAKDYYVENYPELRNKTGVELWKELSIIDRTVSSRENSWNRCEQDYLYETTTDEGFRLKAEEAKGVLLEDLKCILGITGYVEDFFKVPEPDSTEKEGFFFLRTAPDAQSDIRILAEKSKELLNEIIK